MSSRSSTSGIPIRGDAIPVRAYSPRHSLRSWLPALLCLTLLPLLLAACDTGLSTDTGGSGGGSGTTVTPCAGSDCTPGSGAHGGVQVFVEPSAKATPVTQAIAAATKSVWVEVYLLSDRVVIDALENAANRGVDVRVLLETHPYGGGSVSPQEVMQELQAAGVKAEGADPTFHYTHEKAMIVDSATVFIMSCNLTYSGLGGSSSSDRDYGVIDTNAPDVQEASAIFQADWQRQTPTLADPNLVVSPVNARAKLAALIASAHHTLYVEDEEMYDTQSENDLIAAAQHGVNVELILPTSAASSSASDVARLTQGGVHVRYISSPYMHAKLIVADSAEAFVGSENFSSTSLDENRELGILLADTTALSTLDQTFSGDWAKAA